MGYDVKPKTRNSHFKQDKKTNEIKKIVEQIILDIRMIVSI